MAERWTAPKKAAFLSALVETANVAGAARSVILACAPDDERPVWEPSRGELRWTTGAAAFVYSGAKADRLRGPEHDFAWCDEIAKWGQPDATFDNLRMGLRRGRLPQLLVTTTPRPVPIVRRLLTMEGVVVTRGRTPDNPHVSAKYVADLKRDYGRTATGRQEIDGELIEDVAGALWRRARIEGCRIGLELFVPTTSGSIATQGGTPRDVRVSISINAPAATAPDVLARSGRQVARAVRAALSEE